MKGWPVPSLLSPSGALFPRSPLPDGLCRGHSHYGLRCSQHLGFRQLCVSMLGRADLGFIYFLDLTPWELSIVLTLLRFSDGCLKARTMCSMFISCLATLAVPESTFHEAPREHLLLGTGAVVHLPQRPSPSLFSLLEFSSLACPSSVSASLHLLL